MDRQRSVVAGCALGLPLLALLWLQLDGRLTLSLIGWIGLWLLAGGLLVALTIGLFRHQAHGHARRQAQQAARWQAIIDATRQGVWEFDARTNVVHHAPQWKAMLGYADEEIGNDLDEWIARIHPDDVAEVRAAMGRHMAGEAPLYESLHRLRRRDGSYQWVLDRGQIVERAADGQALRIIGTKIEASDRQLTQAQLNRLADHVPGMLFQFQRSADGQTGFLYASAGSRDVYGLTPEQLRSDAGLLLGLLHPEDCQAQIDKIAGNAASLGGWDDEFRIIRPDTGVRWLRGHAKPQKLESGSILWHGYTHDITAEKQQTLKLAETERMLRHLMDNMPMGLCLVDADGQFYFRNRRFQEYFGFPENEPLVLDRWWQEGYPDPDYRAHVIRTWSSAVETALTHDGVIPRQDYQVAMRDGSHRIMAIGGLTFGDHFMATFEDRTEQLAHSELLRRMAYVDGLTGIANRRHFDETLRTEWRRCSRSSQPLALLMIDIDHFKPYNDHHGHQHGDACLQAVATTLQATAGRAQDLVARYGGEEFVCLLPECDLAGALHVAHAMRAAVQALAVAHDDSSVAGVVTVSIGVAALMPSDALRMDQLLACADTHLYRAKQAGRNRIDAGEGHPA